MNCFVDTRFNSQYERDDLIYNSDTDVFMRNTISTDGVKNSNVLSDAALRDWLKNSVMESMVDDDIVEKDDVIEEEEEEEEEENDEPEELTESEIRALETHRRLLQYDIDNGEYDKDGNVIEEEEEENEVIPDTCRCSHHKKKHLLGNCILCPCKNYSEVV